MDNKIYTIYRATNKITGSCYGGFDSSFPKRKWEHHIAAFREKNRNHTSYFHNAIRKYGKKSFDWEILYQSKGDITIGKWMKNVMEPHFIKECSAFWQNGGYNMTFGGEGRFGPMSEQGKKNISESHKGLKHSKETKQKMSAAHKGKLTGDKNPMHGKKGVWNHAHKKLICPHCNLEATIGNAKRWHFDNCKKIKSICQNQS